MNKSFDELWSEAQAAVKSLSPEEARKYKLIEPDTVFLDPRNAEDIRATTGIIPGALNVTMDKINEGTDKQLPDIMRSQSRTIIAACQGGPMGAIAAHALKKRGYSNVYFIQGGTQGWIDAGYATA